MLGCSVGQCGPSIIVMWPDNISLTPSLGDPIPHSSVDHESLCNERHQLYAALSERIARFEYVSDGLGCRPSDELQISHCISTGAEPWEAVHVGCCNDGRIHFDLLDRVPHLSHSVWDWKRGFASVFTVFKPDPGEPWIYG